jgi:hypothetical protein
MSQSVYDQYAIKMDSDKAIQDLLKMWLRLTRSKAAEEAISEHRRRQRSKFLEPQVKSIRDNKK